MFLTASYRDGQTHLAGLRQSGSLKALFPRTDADSFQSVLINTAGGVTGGDVFKTKIKANDCADMTVTTQACERAYCSNDQTSAVVSNELVVSDNARLNWLPQETILYDGCALRRKLSIHLAKDAQFLMVEPIIFGRRAMGETLDRGYFRDKVDIVQDGKLIFSDAIELAGDIKAHLQRPAVAAGAGAMAFLAMVRPDAESLLDKIRGRLPETAGASLISENFLVMRMLALDGFDLRRTLVPILNLLTDNNLPRTWMI